MGEALTIFAIDANASARRFHKRLSKNWFMSSWFILLTVVTAWSSIFLAHSISTDYTLRNNELTVSPNTFLLFVFLVLSGKALIETLHRAVESKELVFILGQPVPMRKVALGKFLSVLFSNLIVVTYALVLVTTIQAGSYLVNPSSWLTITMDYPDGSGNLWVGGLGITHFQIMDVILLSILASCVGFVYSILNSLEMRKRAPGIVAYSLIVVPLYIVMREVSLLPLHQTLVIAALTVIGLASLLPASGFLLEAWTRQTSGKKAMFFQKRSWGRMRLLDKVMSPKMGRLVRKELIINVQKKEIVGNLIAILGLSALLVWGWHRIEGVEELPERVDAIAYPAIISIGIYLAAILQCGLIGLGSIGKEGRKFWILKTMPLFPERLFKAKAVAIMALSPVTILGVALPLPIILGYDVVWVVFFVLMTVSLIMAFTGVGLLMGARYPNFNESMGGMPDVMSMYLLMLICLIIGGGMLVFAGYTLADSTIRGMQATIIVLELSLLILLLGIKSGSFYYDLIEPRPN